MIARSFMLREFGISSINLKGFSRLIYFLVAMIKIL